MSSKIIPIFDEPLQFILPDDAPSKTFVFHVNLFIVAFIALIFIIRLPRAIALLGTSTEWCNGFFLRRVTPRRPRVFVQAKHDAYPNPMDMSTDDSHTLYSYSHANLVQPVNEKGAPVDLAYPPHVASSAKFLRPILSPLRYRITPTLSAAQAILLAIYLYTLIYATFYKANPFKDAFRPGWVAVAQLPFVIAFATKNNVLGSLLGYGYEKLNFLHRFVGRLVVLAANLHSVYYFFRWSMEGTFKQYITIPSHAWGFAALISLDVLLVFSTSFVRHRVYNLFISTHILGFTLLFPSTYLHKPTSLPYILAALSLLLLSYLLQALKSRITTAFLLSLSELDATRITIPSINAGWRAGQHIRLRVFSSHMGFLPGLFESHPFTIASVSGSEEGIVLIVKKSGGWTRKLNELANMGEGRSGEKKVKVMVEGPYGGPCHTILASFSGAVFVVGGSGITFALSCIQDLIHKDLKGQSRVKVIELVWIVQEPASLRPLLPLLTSLIQQSINTPLRISVYYTRAPIGKFPFSPPLLHSPSSSKRNQTKTVLDTAALTLTLPNLTLSPGRPLISKVIEAAITRSVSLGAGEKDGMGITGVVIGVCGPVGIGEEVVKAVAKVDPVRRDQVGGVEVVEEVFGW